MKIRPEIPTIVPVTEVELLIFLIDCSTSMASTETYDRKTKSYHMYQLIKGLLKRLRSSSKKDNFRISFVYFSDIVKALNFSNLEYFPLEVALSVVREPFDVIPGGATAIGSSLIKAKEIIDKIRSNDSLPEDKNVTVFLFTDGRENLVPQKELLDIAEELKNDLLHPSLVTISLGTDADKDILLKLASYTTDKQLRHLELSGVSHLLDDKNKLFMEGHRNDNLTEQRIEALRNFLEVLSTTVND